MTTLTGKSVGFVGLGLMGGPMSAHLARAGARVFAYNRSPAALRQAADLGIIAIDSPAEVARSAETVIIMVSDTTAVEQVLFSHNGVAKGTGSGSLIIDMGTTAVTATRRFAETLQRQGVEYVDAPVSGGQLGAESASLTIMVGGNNAGFLRARPLFEVLGSRITHVGEVGAGQVAKAANQAIVGLTIGAVAEALTLARRAGVDPAKVREALMGGFAASRILEVHGQRMIEGKFDPGGKALTQRKDLAQALELARECGLELPATALNLKLYDRLIAMGYGECDHSALIEVIESRNVEPRNGS